MAITGEYSYLDVAITRQALLGSGATVPEPGGDGLIIRTIQAASARVNAYTGRVFVPTTLTKRIDAPPAVPRSPLVGGGYQIAARVPVPDLQSVMSITAFGTALTADDYRLLHYAADDGTPEMTYLLRVQNGDPVSWYTGAARPWQPWQAIVVTGVFCYDLSGIPATIVEVTEALVLKTWARRIRNYNTGATDGSTVDSVTLDADLQAKLNDFKLTTELVLV